MHAAPISRSKPSVGDYSFVHFRREELGVLILGTVGQGVDPEHKKGIATLRVSLKFFSSP
jgi:hypothetical protein